MAIFILVELIALVGSHVPVAGELAVQFGFFLVLSVALAAALSYTEYVVSMKSGITVFAQETSLQACRYNHREWRARRIGVA